MADFQNYTIIKKLGEGTSGETFLAEKNGKQFAIKQLKIGEIDKWKTIKRFQREARILKKLNHPAIPQYIEFIEDELTLAIVQQYIPGESFYQLIQHEKRFTTPELKDILKQGLELLSYLEQQKIIHRDLSPKNIILDPDGKLWFVDFGAVQRTLSDRNSTITTMGTFGYIAPEQIMGNTTHQSDLYSFGMSMIALISGKSIDQLPEDPMSGTLAEEVFDNLPSELQYTLKKMVESGVKERFSSAIEAINGIGRIVKIPKRKQNHQKAYYIEDGLKMYRTPNWKAYIIDEEIPVSPPIFTFDFNLLLTIQLLITNIVIRGIFKKVYEEYPGDPFLTHIILSTLLILLMTVIQKGLFYLADRYYKFKTTDHILYLTSYSLTLEFNRKILWECPLENLKQIIFTETKNNCFICNLKSADRARPYYCHIFDSKEAAMVLVKDLQKRDNSIEVLWK